jgi:hypothetical protein
MTPKAAININAINNLKVFVFISLDMPDYMANDAYAFCWFPR